MPNVSIVFICYASKKEDYGLGWGFEVEPLVWMRRNLVEKTRGEEKNTKPISDVHCIMI